MPIPEPGRQKPAPAVPPREGGVAATEAERLRRAREHDIDAELEQSFPASDPPSWTMGVTPHDPPVVGKNSARDAAQNIPTPRT
jgi:hypothetical protein